MDISNPHIDFLDTSIQRIASFLSEDQLDEILAHHLRITYTKDNKSNSCTIASLLLINAVMLHEKIADIGWIKEITPLSSIKKSKNIITETVTAWETIAQQSYRPILEPGIEIIKAIMSTGKTDGIEKTLYYIVDESSNFKNIDEEKSIGHIGHIYNEVMDNHISDGAFYTQSSIAIIASKLALDACGDVDWSNPKTWIKHKTVDFACGSGILLTSILHEMIRRAQNSGVTPKQIHEFHKLGVEKTIKGFDINKIALQIAASQLIKTNQEHTIRFEKMGLYHMQYGTDNGNGITSAGTLDIIDQKQLFPKRNRLDIEDEPIACNSVWDNNSDVQDEIVKESNSARIIIMNPPFTNRTNMGSKFTNTIQQRLRKRVNYLNQIIVDWDNELEYFVDKNTISPMFIALADHCLEDEGVMTLIQPTTILSSSSGLTMRRILSKRYHIDTILTCHSPEYNNMSQRTKIHESIIVMRKSDKEKGKTRFVNLDRMPSNESEASDFYKYLKGCNKNGSIGRGWGEILFWERKYIEQGDWTAGIWRSSKLALASTKFDNHPDLHHLIGQPNVHATGQRLRERYERSSYNSSTHIEPHKLSQSSVNETGRLLRNLFIRSKNDNNEEKFPIIKSKGTNGQLTIKSVPDEYWSLKKNISSDNPTFFYDPKQIFNKAGYLLITAGQSNSTSRLTAVASDKKYIGNGWLPVTGFSHDESKALAVFINSTAGRLLLMRRMSKTLRFPSYSVDQVATIKVPNIKDIYILQTLTECWERTRSMVVPQFRDGECEIRRLWDESVAQAMSWDKNELTELRQLLHQEPHISEMDYNSTIN